VLLVLSIVWLLLSGCLIELGMALIVGFGVLDVLESGLSGFLISRLIWF